MFTRERSSRSSHLSALMAAAVAAILTASSASNVRAWELKVCADPAAAPYSSKADDRGFDNRIASVIADRLHAKLSMVWLPDHRSATLRRYLHGGTCDVAMSILDGQNGFLSSHAYYRTGYVFVVPETADVTVTSLDDPVLKGLTIGLPGGARRPTPPALGLARRGLRANLQHFDGRATGAEMRSTVGKSLKDGTIDLAILWGPDAALLSSDLGNLEVTPVEPQIDIPFLPMVASFTLGVRPHDLSLRDAVDGALAEGWDAIQATLADADIPVLSLPRPIATRDAIR